MKLINATRNLLGVLIIGVCMHLTAWAMDLVDDEYARKEMLKIFANIKVEAQ
jgi:hypothetical protein